MYDYLGHLKGIVKDIAFTVGRETLSLVVGKDKDKGENITVPWSQIQAIGEVIILKRPEEAQTGPQQVTCPSCNSPLRYIQEYQRWYCDKEKKYA